ncbi:MAG: D-alanine--D-alanine ligase [Chloroflexi bacterium]|nr:D-alanine--D-alanine ligase [Chloroflexota bacterium]
MSQKIRIGIVFGGRSGEHEVSLASARSVIEAIDRAKYEVVPIGITRDGRWIADGDPMGLLTSGDGAIVPPVALLGDRSGCGLVQLTDCDGQLVGERLSDLDVVFPVLHGTYGEDGTVQGLLELANIPYVGADVLSSAVAMDKAVFRDVMKAHGLPSVEYLVFKRMEWDAHPESLMEKTEVELGYPVFVKPANMGSSVGVSRCENRSQLLEGLAQAARYDRKLVIEKSVPAAREIEVSVLGNDQPMASVPGEIVPSRDFYSYEAKYIDTGEHGSRLLIPAPLPADLTERIRRLAIEAYLAVDCCGMARVDFLLSGMSETLYINEMNTIPGFTEISMYSKLWAASGIDYPHLIDQLVGLAFERHSDRQRSETSYAVRSD